MEAEQPLGESRLTLAVRPNDLDSLGHVNNAVVLEYLEAGRWDWLERQGLGRITRVIAVVARAEINYRAEIPRCQLEVRTVLESPTQAELGEEGLNFRALFRQRIYVPDGARPAVDALITVAFIDAAQRCVVSVQDFLMAAAAD